MESHVRFKHPRLGKLERGHFVADIHHHSMYSHDSHSKVPDILDRAEERGIHLAITDHNRIGGVLEAHRSARGRKLVIPGIEVTTKEGKDVLIYFYTLKGLKDFYDKKLVPRMKEKNSILSNRTKYKMPDLLHDLSHRRCVVVLPHPAGYRTRASYGYFQKRRRRHLLDMIDAIEVINEHIPHKANLIALGWSVQLDKPVTGGSDGHHVRRLGDAVTVARARDKTAFLNAIKKGRTLVVGTELRRDQRLSAGVNIVVDKVKVRQNKRIDRR